MNNEILQNKLNSQTLYSSLIVFLVDPLSMLWYKNVHLRFFVDYKNRIYYPSHDRNRATHLNVFFNNIMRYMFGTD